MPVIVQKIDEEIQIAFSGVKISAGGRPEEFQALDLVPPAKRGNLSTMLFNQIQQEHVHIIHNLPLVGAGTKCGSVANVHEERRLL